MDGLPGVWARKAARWLLVLASTAGGTAQAQLAYEPVALDWTAAEVEHANADRIAALVDRARRAGESGCRDDCGRLQRIFARLLPLARAQTRRSATVPWSLTVVRSKDVQALALPGGQVLISETFLHEQALGDEAVAFVLAHEMAHCILEHERQALTFARMLLPRDVPRTVADVYTEIDLNFALLKQLEPVMQQGEYEADELGLLLAGAAGFEPRRQLGMIEGEAARGDGPEPLIRTHPGAAQRLARLRQRLPLAERLFAQARRHVP